MRHEAGRASARLDLVLLLVFVVLIPPMLASSPSVFRDGDTSWHLATARWMVAHRAIPMADPFSYTALGTPWIDHEWLGALLLGLAWMAAGPAGLAALVGLSIAATFLAIGLEVRRRGPPLQLAATCVLLMPVLLLLTLARPLVLGLPLVALWTVVLLRARDADRVPSLWWALLFVAWVNLHASFAVGIALFAPFAMEALTQTEDRRRTFLRWAALGLACTAAALLNPHGLDGLLVPFGIFGSTAAVAIGEFQPTVPAAQWWFGVPMMATAAYVLWRGIRLPPWRLLLFLGLLYLAMAHVRHQTIFSIVAALLLAEPIARERGWIAPREELGVALANSRWSRGVVPMLVLLAIMAAGVRAAIPLVVADNNATPFTAIAKLPPVLRTQRVMNNYSFGGPLILSGIRPYIDGRGGDVYKERYFDDYYAMTKGDARLFAGLQRRWGFTWTIFSPNDKDMLRLIDASGQFRRIYQDRWAVVHVRRDVRLPSASGSPRAPISGR
ncbi:hypothetical protein [Sphingomonas ginkgonis]|uniref:hypothetical protein n=1 Tax=Sphingomonas ginkgonis TaxID=2315330 RepID=UPI000F8784FD|nr:hypothetical protein [Sphingomonas ginkgonis]